MAVSSSGFALRPPLGNSHLASSSELGKTPNQRPQTGHSDRSKPTLFFSFAPANESACAAEESLFDLSRKPQLLIPLKFLNYFPRNSLTLNLILLTRRMNHPHPLFKPLHSQLLPFEQPVVHGKTSLAPFGDIRFHHHRIPKRRRQQKTRPRFHQRNPRDGVLLQHFLLRQPRPLEQRIRASIKKFKITREINDPQRIAIPPFNMNASLINQHGPVKSKCNSSTRVYT